MACTCPQQAPGKLSTTLVYQTSHPVVWMPRRTAVQHGTARETPVVSTSTADSRPTGRPRPTHQLVTVTGPRASHRDSSTMERDHRDSSSTMERNHLDSGSRRGTATTLPAGTTCQTRSTIPETSTWIATIRIMTMIFADDAVNQTTRLQTVGTEDLSDATHVIVMGTRPNSAINTVDVPAMVAR